MFNFRRVKEEDFIKLYNWLISEHIKEFWYPDSAFSFDEIIKKYKDRLVEGKVDMFVIVFKGLDIGFIQSYFIEDLTPFKVTELSKGIDLYIGDLSYIHKGFGKNIIRDFIKIHIFNIESVKYAGIDPEVNNIIAIKAYEKAGFTHVNTAIDEYSKKLTYYMVLKRTNYFL